jgi:acetyl esterase/lipase
MTELPNDASSLARDALQMYRSLFCVALGMSLLMGALPSSATAQQTDGAVRRVPDIAYLPDDNLRHRLDLFLPLGETKPPLVVWIHGGAWRAGSKGTDGGRVGWLVKEGYAVASINYRLSQEAIFPAQIHDCKAAIRWLRAHAGKYGYDASRIGVAGSSAGGHLVALLGTSGGVQALEGELGEHLDQSSRVQAVCDMWGPTDFLQMGGSHNAPASPESQLIGGPIQDNQEKVTVANPITYVDKTDPPFLLLHGDRDRAVPIGQSELLHAALQKAGVSSKFIPLQGAGHGAPEVPAAEFNEYVRAFFHETLKRSTR